MFRRSLLGLVGLALVVAGAREVHHAQAQAQVLTTINNIDLTFEVPACNGDIVTVSGIIHIISHSTTDAQGGFHFSTAGVFVNTTGVGTDGTRYRVNGGNFSASNTSGATSAEFNTLVILDLISSGGSANSKLFSIVHGTISANGEMTADVSNSRSGC
jgi:hypothetical protein